MKPLSVGFPVYKGDLHTHGLKSTQSGVAGQDLGASSTDHALLLRGALMLGCRSPFSHRLGTSSPGVKGAQRFSPRASGWWEITHLEDSGWESWQTEAAQRSSAQCDQLCSGQGLRGSTADQVLHFFCAQSTDETSQGL